MLRPDTLATPPRRDVSTQNGCGRNNRRSTFSRRSICVHTVNMHRCANRAAETNATNKHYPFLATRYPYCLKRCSSTRCRRRPSTDSSCRPRTFRYLYCNCGVCVCVYPCERWRVCSRVEVFGVSKLFLYLQCSMLATFSHRVPS